MKDYSYGVCPYKIEGRKIFLLLNKTSSVSDWNFFKGKLEQDETIVETALREFYEEAGVMLQERDLESYFACKNPKKDIGVFLYSYQNEKFEFDKREIYLADWVELYSIQVSKNQRKILNDIILYFKTKLKYINYIMKE